MEITQIPCKNYGAQINSKIISVMHKQQPEGPLTEDPSIQESHHDHGRAKTLLKQALPKLTLSPLLDGSLLGGSLLGAR